MDFGVDALALIIHVGLMILIIVHYKNEEK
jgi:hypothetical protein